MSSRIVHTPCLCGHHGLDHSQILADNPCLDCDCPAYMTHQRPNPSIIQGWCCPLCGDCTEGNGTERRRVDWRPWKRLVHTGCERPEGMQGSSLNAGNYSAARRRFLDTGLVHVPNPATTLDQLEAE